MATPILPELFWDEGMTPEMREALARRTMSTLRDLLDAPDDCTLLYVAAPNPGAWATAEARLLAEARGHGCLIVVARPQRPNAYVTADAALFGDLLPAIIDLGPAEITLLVIADPPPVDEMGATITSMVEDRAEAGRRYAGIYLNSGDVLALIHAVDT
ncbi:MAG: hypothetical protein ACRYG4_17450 [Janthinobacterium lividum]